MVSETSARREINKRAPPRNEAYQNLDNDHGSFKNCDMECFNYEL